MQKISLAIALAAITLLSSCGSDPYEVKRSIDINTPAEVIGEQINCHKNRENWSPWEKIDPNMKKELTGPECGVGAIQSWSSENEDVGTGSIEILEVDGNSYTKSKLTFTAPWESESTIEWWLEEADGTTKVTWGNKGEMPKMAAMFMDETMDEMLGPDFEKGLAALKAHCEANYTPPAPEPAVSDTTRVENAVQEAVETVEEVVEG